MATKRAPLTEALLKVLSFDEWRTRDDVISELSVQVPPGKARRMYEHRAMLGDRPHLLDKPDEYKIRTGAREILNKTIGSAIAGRLVERQEVDGVRMIRRVPKAVAEGTIQEDAIRKIINDVLSGSTGQLPLAFLMTPAQARRELVDVLVTAIAGGSPKEQDGS